MDHTDVTDTGGSASADNIPRTVVALRNFFLVSNREIAEATGIAQRTLSNKLRGIGAITAAELLDLADTFGVPPLVLYLPRQEALRWVLDHEIKVREKARLTPLGIRWTSSELVIDVRGEAQGILFETLRSA